jgi:hypothetical protein
MPHPDRPGAPATPPQHILDQSRLPAGGDTDRTAWKHKPTGADPHPSTEENYDLIEHPGGTDPVNEDRDIGPNPSAHTGTPKRRPRNAENT